MGTPNDEKDPSMSLDPVSWSQAQGPAYQEHNSSSQSSIPFLNQMKIQNKALSQLVMREYGKGANPASLYKWQWPP